VRADVYFSCDIEADGPIPGPYSMLSFGFVVCGWFDGEEFHRVELDQHTFYAELRPISGDFVPSALEIAHLDRELLKREGEDPAAGMTRAADWVESVAGSAKPVFVGWPAAFDWMFTHWYFERFAGRDPFGYASYVDIKSFYIARARLTLDAASPNFLPPELRSPREHTHNAIDDATRQGEVFASLFDWYPRR
jgi:hypothetical protein